MGEPYAGGVGLFATFDNNYLLCVPTTFTVAYYLLVLQIHHFT